MIYHRGLLDGWLIIERGDGVHVVPNNDIQFHTIEGNKPCSCKPELWIRNKTLVIVHNSFDGRELVEPLTDLKS